MSTEVFDFMAVATFGFDPTFETTLVAGNDGIQIGRPDTGLYGIYRASFEVHVPGPGIATGTERTLADWIAWDRARQGAYDSWLWKDPWGVPALYAVAVSDTDGQLGNGNASKTDFALAHKHLDASTLLVYVNGVLQTVTTHYTLEDNNTDAPYVAFVSAPGSGLPVTVAYEFYHPVRFTTDPTRGEWRRAGTSFRIPVSIQEVYAGAHRVSG